MGEFQNGIFGCFNNVGMCVFTFLLPCYTQGKLSETLGDDCLLCGLALLVPVLNLYVRLMTRAKVRENKGIEGDLLGDLVCTLCCGLCSLIQEAQEMSVETPLGAGESIARS